jgi:hypothetical protein
VTIILLILNVFAAHKLGFVKWLGARKKKIAVTLTWSVAIAGIVIKSYWLVYATNPVLVEHGIGWTQVDQWIPRLDTLDCLLIFLLGIIAGAILVDLETVLYSLIATTILSFLVPIAYSSLFIWYILRWGEAISVLGGLLLLQNVIYVAIISIFRMVFPIVVILSLLGVLLGAFGRGFIDPSAED